METPPSDHFSFFFFFQIPPTIISQTLLSCEEKIKKRWISSYHELSLSLDITQVLPAIKVFHQDRLVSPPTSFFFFFFFLV